jgi:hypothetical protein
VDLYHQSLIHFNGVVIKPRGNSPIPNRFMDNLVVERFREMVRKNIDVGLLKLMLHVLMIKNNMPMFRGFLFESRPGNGPFGLFPELRHQFHANAGIFRMPNCGPLSRCPPCVL